MDHQISTPDLTALFNSVSAGFIFFTTDDVIGYCNETAASLFGASPSRMIGTKLTDYPIRFLSEQGVVLTAHQNPMLKACKGKSAQLDKLFHIKFDGKSEGWLRCNIEPIYDMVKDSLAGAIVSFVEVTDAIVARREQKETEEKYSHHFTMNDSATFLATKEGQYLGVSRGAEKLFGYTSGEFKKLGRQGILIEDEKFKKALAERDRKGKAVTEVKGRRKDGKIIPLLWYASLFTTSTGEELVSVTMIDISEKKELEQNARLLDYNLQLILENTDESFILLDGQLKVLTFNQAAIRAFGEIHGTELRIGRKVTELFNSIHTAELRNILAEVLGGKSRELQRVYQLPEGRLRVFQSVFRPLYKQGNAIGIAINSRDITQKYKIQQELLQSHERYKKAAMASFDILWEHDLAAGNIYFSETFLQDFGHNEVRSIVAAEEFVAVFLHPEDRAMILNAVTAFINGNEIHFTYPVHRLLKKDGSFIYAEAQVIASRDENGAAYLLTGVTRDITERYLMERKLRESNERYSLVSKATFDVIWDWDITTNYNWFSDNITSLFGHTITTNNLKDWEEKIHPDDREGVLKSLYNAIEEGRRHWQAEYRFQRADGSYAIVYDRGYALYDAENKPYRMIGALQDITELKNLQKKVIEDQLSVHKKITEATIRSQEQEREELGKELHDNINQILATCKLMLSLSINNNELQKECLPKAYEYVNKAIEEIRVLSKSLVPPSLGDIGLSEALNELVLLFTGTMNTDIVITGDSIGKNTIDNHLQLMAYRIVQEQLNNIIKYAKATKVQIEICLQKNLLKIAVCDNGVGFNVNEKKKGIGLKNIKSRAEFYGGTMQIISSPGKGCRLAVTIPVI